MIGVSGKGIGMPQNELVIVLDEIKHTMNCEGLQLTQENEKDIVDILSGNRTANEVKADILIRNGLRE